VSGLSRRMFLTEALATAGAVFVVACSSKQTSPSATTAPAKPTTAAASSAPAASTNSPAATAAPAQQVSSAGGQRVQVEVWTGWTEAAAKNIESILALYNKSQDKFEAKHVVVPGSGTVMLQKILAAVTAGTPPAAAVIFNGSGTVYTLAAEGGILPMTDVADTQQLGAMQKWVSPAVWNIGVYDGKPYALPMWTQSYGLFYNASQVQAAGIDPSQAPKTMDDLDTYADKLTVKDSSGNITRLGLDWTSIQAIIAVFHGKFLSDDGTKITANDPNNVKALDWIVNRYKKYGPQNVQNFYSALQNASGRSTTQDPFLTGKYSTHFDGSWEIGSTQQYAPTGFDWNVWPIPGPSSDVDPGAFTYGDVFVVPKGTKSKAASWDVVSWLTGATGNRDVYTQLFVVWPCVNMPDSPQMLTYPTFKKDVVDACKGFNVFTDYFYKQDRYFLYPPKIPTAASYMDLLTSETQKAELGQKSVQAALDDVNQQAQKELDDWQNKK